MSGIAIRTSIMVRQSTSARTYVVLARLSTRAAYARGLLLATALLRIPLFLLLCALALLLRRLIDPTAANMLIGAPGLLIVTILVSSLTIALTSPIGTRRKRIVFLVWLALVLFSASPIVRLPDGVINVLSIVRLPLIPVGICYNIGVNSSFDLASCQVSSSLRCISRDWPGSRATGSNGANYYCIRIGARNGSFSMVHRSIELRRGRFHLVSRTGAN